MVVRRYILVCACVLTLLGAPQLSHAQTPASQAQLLALLEQITQLTQLVIALQAQLAVLEQQEAARGVSEDTQNTVVLPVRVLLVDSPYAHARAQVNETDIRRVFDTYVNAHYWKQANINWQVQRVETYTPPLNTDFELEQATLEKDQSRAHQALTTLPTGIIRGNEFVVLVVRDFGAGKGNGVYFGSTGIAIVSETNGRESGDDFLGYLFAHELGHALGLGHVTDTLNIMHSGGRSGVARSLRTTLTDEQKEQAYTHAVTHRAPFFEDHTHITEE